MAINALDFILCILFRYKRHKNRFSDVEIENIALGIASGDISYEKLKETLIEKHKNNL